MVRQAFLDTYRQSTGTVCGLNLFCDQAAYSGLTISEPEALGWSAAFGFEFTTGDEKRTVTDESLVSSLGTITGLRSHWYSRLLAVTGVRIDTHHVADPAEVKSIIMDVLEEGKPIQVAADGFYLPFSPYYREKHAVRHQFTVAIGFESSQNFEVYLTQGVPPAQGFVREPELIEASFSPYLAPGQRGCLQILSYPDSLNDMTQQTIRSLDESARAFLPGAGSPTPESGTSGYEALTEFSRYALSTATSLSQQDLGSFTRNLHFSLCCSDGPIISTRLFAYFLKRLADTSDAPVSQDLAMCLMGIGKEWQIAANLLLKGGLSGKLKDIRRATDQLISVADAIRQVMEALQTVTGNVTCSVHHEASRG